VALKVVPGRFAFTVHISCAGFDKPKPRAGVAGVSAPLYLGCISTAPFVRVCLYTVSLCGIIFAPGIWVLFPEKSFKVFFKLRCCQ